MCPPQVSTHVAIYHQTYSALDQHTKLAKYQSKKLKIIALEAKLKHGEGKAREIAEEKEAVEQYGSSDSGASLGDILGAALKGDE